MDPAAAIGQGIAYLPHDRKRESAIPGFTVRENLTLPQLRTTRGWLSLRRERAEADVCLDRLGVQPQDAAERVFSTLSGGNQQKVVLARWMRCGAQVLALDEPTQGVDVAAKTMIYQALTAAARQGTSGHRRLLRQRGARPALRPGGRPARRPGDRRTARRRADRRGDHAAGNGRGGGVMSFTVPPVDTADHAVPGQPAAPPRGLAVRLGLDRLSGIYLWALFVLIYALWISRGDLPRGGRSGGCPQSAAGDLGGHGLGHRSCHGR
jgi:hypothetical protein